MDVFDSLLVRARALSVGLAVLSLALLGSAQPGSAQPGEAPAGIAGADPSSRVTPGEYRQLERSAVRAIGAIGPRTIQVMIEGRPLPVRLFGVGTDIGDPGFEALGSYVLHNWIAGEMVRCRSLTRDAEGRVHAYIDRDSDDHDVIKELLAQGYLRLDNRAGRHDRYARWVTAQEQAAMHRRGMWGEHRPRLEPATASAPRPGETAPGPSHGGAQAGDTAGDDPRNGAETNPGAATGTEPDGSGAAPGSVGATPGAIPSIFITRSGSRYHTRSCRFARSATEIAPKDAQGRYEPCRVCKPPPIAELLAGG